MIILIIIKCVIIITKQAGQDVENAIACNSPTAPPTNADHLLDDILLCHSTIAGLYSFVSNDGSLFIQTAIEVFSEKYKTEDVVSIVKEISIRVALLSIAAYISRRF